MPRRYTRNPTGSDFEQLGHRFPIIEFQVLLCAHGQVSPPDPRYDLIIKITNTKQTNCKKEGKISALCKTKRKSNNNKRNNTSASTGPTNNQRTRRRLRGSISSRSSSAPTISGTRRPGCGGPLVQFCQRAVIHYFVPSSPSSSPSSSVFHGAIKHRNEHCGGFLFPHSRHLSQPYRQSRKDAFQHWGCMEGVLKIEATHL